MRKALDRLYRASGALAALFLVAICGVVLLQVGANLLDKISSLITGEAIGLVVPSYAEFTGFFLASASFFALAYTLRAGSHIRVSLVIQNVSGGARRAIELWCISVAGVLTGYFAFFMVSLVFESLEFGDVSPGMVPVPLWLPQTSMAIGLVVLTVALIDEFQSVLRGTKPTYAGAGDALLSEGDFVKPTPPPREPRDG